MPFIGTGDKLKIPRYADDMVTSSSSIRFALNRALIIAAAASTFAGCDATTSPIERPEDAAPTEITWIWNTQFDGYASQEVPSLPSVVVRDQFGRPMVGIKVLWAVTAGGGSLKFPISITNGLGIATLQQWTLGPDVGENVVTATVAPSLTQSFKVVSKLLPNNGDPCAGCWDY